MCVCVSMCAYGVYVKGGHELEREHIGDMSGVGREERGEINDIMMQFYFN